MPLTLGVVIAPGIVFPPGSRLVAWWDGSELATLPLDKYPASAVQIPDRRSLGEYLHVEAILGDNKSITLQAKNVPGDTAGVMFLVHAPPERKKLFFAGSVVHAKNQVNVCQVRCLNDGNTAGPGQCIECENDVAIVELCC